MRSLLLPVVIGAPLLGGLLCLVRGYTRRAERAPAILIAAALLAAAAATALSGPAAVDPTHAPAPVAMLAWLVSYVVGFVGFVALVRARLGRLPRTAWLDGLLAALVFESALLLGLLRADGVAIGADTIGALLFPFADVLLVALFVAAAAQAGWRLGGWTSFIAGTAVLVVADAAFAACALGASSALLEASPIGWPIAHALFVYGVWARPAAPRPFPAGRPAVPVGFGLAAAAILSAAALTTLDVSPASAALATLGLVTVLLRFAATIFENERMLRATGGQALTDALTGLANRRHLMSDLAHSVSVATPSRPHALVLYDLDGFKRYNDTFGHQAGDELLTAVGIRLRDAVAGRGAAYRLGGDEFCVLVHDARGGVAELAATAAEALSSHTTGFPVTPSYGWVLVPAETTEPSVALQLADQRMYADKASKSASPRAGAAV